MNKTLEMPTPDPERIEDLTRSLKCHPILSTLLVNRKITAPAAALDFIHPTLKNIRPPDNLCDIENAVSRISAAIEGHEKILVFGDYDVDGITATCLLTEFLRQVGAETTFYIPHRVAEGYSLDAEHIENGTVPAGTRLIITVDCGTSSLKAVAAAEAAGIDVIITDHHTVTKNLPAARAIVNPCRPDCKADLGFLAGVGVAFYLVIALRKRLRERNYFKQVPEPNLKKLCDLVALGTVADMVPLVRENRILTAIGLKVINTGRRPGLDSLIRTSRISNGRVESEDIAYKLAPRLNAAGRISHALEAARLLIATEDAAATEMAETLESLNNERRRIEQAAMEGILAKLESTPALLDRPAIVLSSAEWHPGVTGILSSRLARQFNRPVVLVTMQDGLGKGSGRSIPGIDMIRCLGDCAPVLERFGGHPAAAGITVTSYNFDHFKELFEQAVEKMVGLGLPLPVTRVDCEIELAQVQPEFMDALDLLKPFGQDNPEPLFLATSVNIGSVKTVGRRHSRLVLSQGVGNRKKTLPGIYFNSGTIPRDASQAVFTLRWNRWNGEKRIQAIVKHLA